ncbi:hypothetical protein MXL15_06935 [Pseudomonas mosselii]|uniref:RHS repeat-associated core domain-containing protein n=1 Tax=Pseudomonas mosselii TaxID=78327 RepID=UPI002DBF081A|nr:RHS repeat-associated core domain-containing protein [Pseudomonas mosselii]MEB5931933.1 hypothetical protein [Pseudomonas mosselii]
MSLYLPMLDHQRSPFGGSTFSRTYTPYGANGVTGGPKLGFCGQPRDSLTSNYPLGSGHRHYSPGMCRFQSPDLLSPFGEGGLNAYGYCAGDPINKWDPSGGIIEPIMAVTASTLAARDAAKGLHMTLHQGDELRAQKWNSIDPAVLNQVEPTLTRQVGETAAVAVPTLGIVAGVAAIAGVGVSPLLGPVALGVGLFAWGVGKAAKYREKKLGQNPIYFVDRSAGRPENRQRAVFNLVKASMNQDIANRQAQRQALWEPIHQEMRRTVVMGADYDKLLDAVNAARNER